MDTNYILAYFREQWDEVERLAVREGVERAFYPIIIQETDDPRLIDPALPALDVEYVKLLRARITNPSAAAFEGLILEEKEREEIELSVRIVDVIYLKRDLVYSLQCVKEGSDESKKELQLQRYIAVGLPQPAIIPEEELQKAYNDLESLLKTERDDL